VRVQKVLLSSFHRRPRPKGVSLESTGLENILQVPGHRAGVDQYDYARNALSATLSVKYGYISAQKLKGDCSKCFAVSISLQKKAIRS